MAAAGLAPGSNGSVRQGLHQGQHLQEVVYVLPAGRVGRQVAQRLHGAGVGRIHLGCLLAPQVVLRPVVLLPSHGAARQCCGRARPQLPTQGSCFACSPHAAGRTELALLPKP
jgi:hypothetical protein